MKGGKKLAIAIAATMVLAAAVGVQSVDAQNKPEKTTISGVLVDMTCATKGMKLMDSDHNAVNNEHKTPDGMVESCATNCLKGGQPAGIYSDGKIQALLLANPSVNLYKFATKTVDIQGWWAGDDDDEVKSFVPAKIRLSGTADWTEVKTRAMHD